MKYAMVLGHEYNIYDVVHRVVCNVQPKRHCTGPNARFRLMGVVSVSSLTPVELFCAAFFLSVELELAVHYEAPEVL